VEGDDFNEPVADHSRAVLDGHVVLSRRLASAGHFPAIEVLGSASRLRDQVIPSDQLDAANRFQALLAAYREKEDLISIGAYQKGSDHKTDAALALRDPMLRFLRQGPDECAGFQVTRDSLLAIAAQAEARSEERAA
jgi:flagellar biosynthesis/type III secretory pathway ATPase